MDRDPSFNIRECLKRTKLPDEVLSLSSTRTIHLNSSIQLILETNTFLAQALSLQDEFIEATKLIDGRLFMLELSRVEAEEAILRKPLPSSSYSSWRKISAPKQEVAATKSVSKSFLPKEGRRLFSRWNQGERLFGSYFERIGKHSRLGRRRGENCKSNWEGRKRKEGKRRRRTEEKSEAQGGARESKERESTTNSFRSTQKVC